LRLALAKLSEPRSSIAPGAGKELVEVGYHLRIHAGGNVVLDLVTGLSRRVAPIGAWLWRRRVFELEQMLDDPSNLAADGVQVASTQALHLLGQIFEIEGAVAPCHCQGAQRRCLLLGPGVVVALIQRPFEHLGHSTLRALAKQFYRIGSDGAKPPASPTRGRLAGSPLGMAADSRLTSPLNLSKSGASIVANPLGPGSHPCVA
jgi:hypothetical protein